MKPDRDNLLQTLKAYPHGMTIHAIHKTFCVVPQNEDDRNFVWRIGQGLAQLVRAGWVSLDTSDGTRFFCAI